MKTLQDLENEIGIVFNDKQLLKQAFIHDSYLNETKEKVESNERLELLGDAVLGLIVTEYAYKNNNGSESELSKFKKKLIENDNLAKISEELGLDAFLLKGVGESKNEAGKPERIANTLEALIGAIFIDQGEEGYKRATEFVSKYLLNS